MQEQTIAGFWLSPQQKLAWKLETEVLHAGSRAVCSVAVSGAVDPARLKSAVSAAIGRHEILRTTFRRQTGMKLPFQVVLDSGTPVWEEVDFSVSPDSKAEIEKIFSNERRTGSSAEDAPVVRIVLARETQTSSTLILSLSGLCGDVASLRVLVQEIVLLYSGKIDLPEPFRYVQFAQWQLDLLDSEGEDEQRGRDFWKKQAAPEYPALPWAAKPVEDFSPEVYRVAAAKNFATLLLKADNASSILLAAWAALIGRLSGRTAFSLGVAASSREFEELENAIGCFERTLPISFDIQGHFSFSDVQRRTRDAVDQSVAVQEYFASEALDPEAVSFAYRDLGTPEVAGDVRFELERVYVISERFKLRLVAVRRESELTLEFHYDSSRLSRNVVERIAGWYQTLLAAAVANPATPISKLPLLSEVERRQLLVEWNQTATAYPAGQCLHQLFQAQAASTPSREALRFGEQAYSYRELNERANQLAHYLHNQGVGPDKLVGLCLERSAETIVAVLAILKAGGAYVPLNLDNPPARLQQQLEGAVAVLTESKLAGQIPQFPGTTIVLDRDQEQWAGESAANPDSLTNPDNLVYVIYTSGSTGVPKGVAVRHRNLVNYADFISKRLELSRHPEGLQFATVSTLGADLGNTCIYPSLISGGTLHVVGYETATDATRLAQYTAKHPIDVLKIVPSHLSALLQAHSEPEQARKLLPRKYLLFGGETLTPKLVEKIESLNPACEILNHYGPTETTVGSLTLKLKDYDWKSKQLASIPIGRPIQNTQLYVLDQNLEPVPAGVVGELYIAGAGVTAGYLNQPEKTAERFLKNPFSTDPNSKMYRTGDLVRYLEDGAVEFLGRGDDQVKVRGFRIELGEIESVLLQHSGVKQALVLARENEQGDKRLLGYVVAQSSAAQNSGKELTGDDLRDYLKQHVPDYMVPQAIVILPKFPLTPNGKIDRQALPEPEQATKRAYVAPSTDAERTIAEIWAEVLRREPTSISVEDNFFDLGGHSLLATQVVSRIRQKFSVEVPVRAMFDQPTITKLAGIVAEAEPITQNEEDEFSITAVEREAYRA